MFSELTVDVVDRVASVEPAQWAALFPGHPDSYELVRLTESCGLNGFSFGSIVVRHAGRPVVLVPLFRTTFDLARLVDGFARNVASMLSRFVPSLLRPRLLGVGFVEGEWGAIGLARDLPDPIRHRACELASKTLDRLHHRQADLLLHLNFLPDGLAAFAPEKPGRFACIDTYPCARVPLPYAHIDEYYERLSKNMRKDLRRKLRSAEGITILHTRQPGAWLEAIHNLYLRTVERSELSMGIQRRSMFASVCDRVPGARYVLYVDAGRLLAFNLLIESESILVDKYFCTDLDAGRRLGLYFVSWIENIRYCIDRRIPVYHAGPGAEATKARLGAKFLPSVTHFRHRNPLAQALLRRFRGLLAYKPAIDPNA
ncbi:MAG: GNAT family N-acetyltransferase, partial [Tepidisphaeraceae bacterium]